MLSFIFVLFFICIVGVFLSSKLHIYIKLSSIFLYLILGSLFISVVVIIPLWFLFLAFYVLWMNRHLRFSLLTKPLMAYAKRMLPTISETEKVALEAGQNWIEEKLFSGQSIWTTLKELKSYSLTSEELAFLENETETLCEMIDDWKNYQAECIDEKVFSYIKEKGFLGLIIPKEYGGKGFSASMHSLVVSKIASTSVSTAVTVMVPNSLGPAELLLKYGDKEQKQRHLPKLACGKEIPCFGLTTPEAGSDAGSLQCHGEVIKDKDGQLSIRLSWSKRYITLAPIATLIGIAFKLSDPHGYLKQNKTEIGITLALIPADIAGIKIGHRHKPLGLSFMNGTIEGKDVVISLDAIIGGTKMAGQGWRMLMECLSIGRAISLPALATAAAKLAYKTSGAYALLREQFNLPIGQFEGVSEALGRIGGKTYLMEATRKLSALAVDLNIKPALVSAITKYHLTELAREVINDAMDIHAGRAVQFGPRNYLGLTYLSMPMAITVEGANILTRSLIIFGQGAIRCHPFIQRELQAINTEDSEQGETAFDVLLKSHIAYSANNFLRIVFHTLTADWFNHAQVDKAILDKAKKIARMSIALALISDLALLNLGGQLKRKEVLSARLGDVLSYLYMGVAVIKYFDESNKDGAHVLHARWALTYCLYKINRAFDAFLSNYPNRGLAISFKTMIFPFGLKQKYPKDKDSFALAKIMMHPSPFRDEMTQFCYQGNEQAPVGRIEDAFNQVAAISATKKKLKAAQKEGRFVSGNNYQAILAEALKQGVIEKSEHQQLEKAYKATIDALAVDEFK